MFLVSMRPLITHYTVRNVVGVIVRNVVGVIASTVKIVHKKKK